MLSGAASCDPGSQASNTASTRLTDMMRSVASFKLEAARLDHLPNEVLLKVFWGLTRAEVVSALPLICRAFSRLLSLSNPFWAESSLAWTFTTFPAVVDGPKLCNWISPRLQGLTEFHCPLGAFLQVGSVAFASDLLNVQPSSLTQVKLQGDCRLGFYRNRTMRKEEA